MNCRLAQEQMQDRLDGTLAAELPEMQAHLAECASCAQLHAASQRLAAGLRLLNPPQPPLDLTKRLVAAVLADQHAQRRRALRRAAVYSLAACLLVGAFGLGFYGFALHGSRDDTPSTTTVVIVKTKPPAAPAPSVRGSVNEAGSAIASLTTRTADETVGQTRLLVPMVTGPAMDELDPPPAVEPTKSYLEAGQGVSVALEPVTNSARRAVDLFRRDLPHVETKP